MWHIWCLGEQIIHLKVDLKVKVSNFNTFSPVRILNFNNSEKNNKKSHNFTHEKCFSSLQGDKYWCKLKVWLVRGDVIFIGFIHFWFGFVSFLFPFPTKTTNRKCQRAEDKPLTLFNPPPSNKHNLCDLTSSNVETFWITLNKRVFLFVILI